MDPVKDAFDKVKSDIDFLNNELNSVSEGVSETRRQMSELCEVIQKLFEKVDNIAKKQAKLAENQEKQDKIVSTHMSLNQTPSTHTSTVPQEIGGLKPQNLGISTGNEGVSTDRQTHRQTDNSTHFMHKNTSFSPSETNFNSNSSQSPSQGDLPQNISPPANMPNIQALPQNMPTLPNIYNTEEILASLDSIKKEVRLKVKRLTEQEWLIFSTIYQLEEQLIPVDYKTISQRLNLTESSIRDYVGRLIKKGIPVDKTKVNNKSIQLSISPNLKKIASLSTIMQLRGL